MNETATTTSTDRLPQATSPQADDLVRCAQQGDRPAFERLLEQHYDLMLRFALKIANSRTDAEDITQLSCIKLAQGLRHFRFESAFSTWLYQVVLNCARDFYRRQTFEALVDTSPEATAQDRSESTVLLQQVSNLIEGLGEGFRETVSLVVGEGLTHRQAAEILGIRESTVSWRMHELRRQLKPVVTSESS